MCACCFYGYKNITRSVSTLKSLIKPHLNKPNFIFKASRVFNTMPSKPNLLKPPDHVRGQTTLNKTEFEKQITIPCLNVPFNSKTKISKIVLCLKKYFLRIENFKPVQHGEEQDATLVYLNPELVEKWSDFAIEDQNTLQSFSLNQDNLKFEVCTLNYDNYSVEDVFHAVLPQDSEGSSSFTKVGHIVHINLRDHLHPYKEIIGEVLYDKVPNCRTVVNKVANIDNTYRNFEMEVLKGDQDMVTEVKENKCLFKFDFGKVYWNSRLCTEHERIVKMIDSGSVVFDVFAGVGPFAVPLAKKKCRVFANDLNPESFRWLNLNRERNKVGDYLKTFNQDGKDFILNEIKQQLPEFLNKHQIYIIMNLPGLALEFLKYFINLYEDLDVIETPLIIIVYCFVKGEDYMTLTKNSLFQHLNSDIEDKIIDIFRVRTVSSLKEMMRIRFKLDRNLLINHKRKHAPDCVEDTKKSI